MEFARVLAEPAVLPGDEVFKLYDTYGLPVDFMIDAARDQRVLFDEPGFRQALEAQRQKWLNPTAIDADELKKRTLTNLYNARPTWLDNAHRELDRTVLNAYGWPEDIADEELLKRLLKLNRERPSTYSTDCGDERDGNSWQSKAAR